MKIRRLTSFLALFLALLIIAAGCAPATQGGQTTTTEGTTTGTTETTESKTQTTEEKPLPKVTRCFKLLLSPQQCLSRILR